MTRRRRPTVLDGRRLTFHDWCTRVSCGSRAGATDRSNWRPLPENRRADPDHRRAFLDGRLEIVAHAHRQVPERVARNPVGEPAVAQLPQLLRTRAGLTSWSSFQGGSNISPASCTARHSSAASTSAATPASPAPRTSWLRRPGPPARGRPAAPRPPRPRHRAVCSRSSESTEWMQAKGAAAFRALFDCRWPIRCHLRGKCRLFRAIFCRAS